MQYHVCINVYMIFYVWRMKQRCKEEMSHRKLAWAAKWCWDGPVRHCFLGSPEDSWAACRQRSCRGEVWCRDQPCFLVASHRCPGPWMLHGMLDSTTGRGNQVLAFIWLLWIPRGGLHVWCKHQQTQVAAAEVLEERRLFCTTVQPLEQTSMRFSHFLKLQLQ